MKKVLFFVAALLMVFFAACTNDFGTGNSLSNGDGPITVPGSHKTNGFEVPDTTQVETPSEDEESLSGDPEGEPESSSSEEEPTV